MWAVNDRVYKQMTRICASACWEAFRHRGTLIDFLCHGLDVYFPILRKPIFLQGGGKGKRVMVPPSGTTADPAALATAADVAPPIPMDTEPTDAHPAPESTAADKVQLSY